MRTEFHITQYDLIREAKHDGPICVTWIFLCPNALYFCIVTIFWGAKFYLHMVPNAVVLNWSSHQTDCSATYGKPNWTRSIWKSPQVWVRSFGIFWSHLQIVLDGKVEGLRKKFCVTMNKVLLKGYPWGILSVWGWSNDRVVDTRTLKEQFRG